MRQFPCPGGLWTWAPRAGELVRPLWPQEYLNSVLDKDVSLHSRRLDWETQLHFDNPTYIGTHFSQVSPTGPVRLCCPRASPSPGGGRPSLLPLQGEGMVAGRGLSPRCPLTAPPGAAGLPAGAAVGQRPGRRPTRQAGGPAAPQQGPRGAPLRVSVTSAPTPIPSSKVTAPCILHGSDPMGAVDIWPTPRSRAGPKPHSWVWSPSLAHVSHWLIYLAPAACPALTDQAVS